MLSNTIKYIADFILGIFTSGTSGDNYKQFPLPLAIIVCLVALVVVGLLVVAGVMILLNNLG
jgi:hypothetical protein